MRKAGQLKFAVDFFEHCQLLQPNEVEVNIITKWRILSRLYQHIPYHK